MTNITQRDAFWDAVYEIAFHDKDVLLVSADMGAPALDKFRRDLPDQYIDVGIAEQQAISVAAGLALSGKKAYTYAIAPFITLRCYEQIRVNLASMNLPVTIVGVGAGMSYDDSGPTHHTLEDIGALRMLPHTTVHSVTDSVMASALGKITREMKGPDYVRLDREPLPNVYQGDEDFSAGMTTLAAPGDLVLIATGNMVLRALEVREALKQKSLDVGVIDVYRLPIDEQKLVEAISGVQRIFTLEEHTLPAGFGSAICEVLADNGVLLPVKRIGCDFSAGYCYKYGGRDHLQSLCGLDRDKIVETILGTL